MAKPLVDGIYTLEKFEGKGGWTYAAIPEILQDPEKPFGWVEVRGSVDGFPLKHYKLQPMGSGQLFLPVKAVIRKKIGKQAGDQVHVILFQEEGKFEVPQEIIDCLEMESSELLSFFLSYAPSHQKAWVDHVYEAKKQDTRDGRIVKMIKVLSEEMADKRTN